jgi:hypothetical protein
MSVLHCVTFCIALCVLRPAVIMLQAKTKQKAAAGAADIT